jgi:hypothetical protein
MKAKRGSGPSCCVLVSKICFVFVFVFLQNAYECSSQSRKAERHKKDNAHDSGSRRGPVRICVVGGEGQEAVRTSWKRMALGAESVEAHRSRILGFFFVLFFGLVQERGRRSPQNCKKEGQDRIRYLAMPKKGHARWDSKNGQAPAAFFFFFWVFHILALQ